MAIDRQILDNLYEYLVAYNSIYGRLPTNKELAYQFEKDLSTIHHHMCSLIDQGKIERLKAPIWYKLKEK